MAQLLCALPSRALAAALLLLTWSALGCNSITTRTFTTSACGDAVLDEGEGCDDGNDGDLDGCDATCQVEAGYTCTGEPSVCAEDEDPAPRCGDGAIDEEEACDDGNTDPDDGCDLKCVVSNGYTCTGEPSVCTRPPDPDPVCGNGALEGDERCDDDNADPGDGCDVTCQVEDGYTCAGTPSVCVAIPPRSAAATASSRATKPATTPTQTLATAATPTASPRQATPATTPPPAPARRAAATASSSARRPAMT